MSPIVRHYHLRQDPTGIDLTNKGLETMHNGITLGPTVYLERVHYSPKQYTVVAKDVFGEVVCTWYADSPDKSHKWVTVMGKRYSIIWTK